MSQGRRRVVAGPSHVHRRVGAGSSQEDNAGGLGAAFPGGEVEQLQARLADCIAPLDYAHLNDHLDEPTDENIARWVRARRA